MPGIDVGDGEARRIELRVRTHALNHELGELAADLHWLDADAKRAVNLARASLFQAWAILCAPPPEDDEDH